MLFFNDPRHLELPFFLPFFRRLVPPRHVYAAARSPRSENVEDQFFAPEVGDRAGPAAVQGRENRCRERSPSWNSTESGLGAVSSWAPSNGHDSCHSC